MTEIKIYMKPREGGFCLSIKQYSEELEKILGLRTALLAIKLLASEDEIPDGAIRPKRDQGVHYSLCQAFALARFNGDVLAMMTEDHWCWAPLIGFGLVEFHEKHDSFSVVKRFLGIENEEAAAKFLAEFPRLEYGKYAGLLVAPLKKADFAPDVILIYATHTQLRQILLAIKFKSGKLVASQFDAIDSCVYSTIPVILNGGYRITFPDPGDVERALAGDDEVIFSLSPDKLPELVAGLSIFAEGRMFFQKPAQKIEPDHPRPDFYRELFAIWNLDV
jgi:uncharacterized protein (DUF169 family)